MLIDIFVGTIVLGVVFAALNQYARRIINRFARLYEVKTISGGTVIVGLYRLHRLQKAERVADYWVL